MQLVIMSLKPHEEIGMEIHPHTSQFIRIESGKCKIIINKNSNNKVINLQDESFIIIPSNTWHNIINTGITDLKLYTIYTPFEHKENLIQKYKPKSQIGGNKIYKIYKFKNL